MFRILLYWKAQPTKQIKLLTNTTYHILKDEGKSNIIHDVTNRVTLRSTCLTFVKVEVINFYVVEYYTTYSSELSK